MVSDWAFTHVAKEHILMYKFHNVIHSTPWRLHGSNINELYRSRKVLNASPGIHLSVCACTSSHLHSCHRQNGHMLAPTHTWNACMWIQQLVREAPAHRNKQRAPTRLDVNANQRSTHTTHALSQTSTCMYARMILNGMYTASSCSSCVARRGGRLQFNKSLGSG